MPQMPNTSITASLSLRKEPHHIHKVCVPHGRAATVPPTKGIRYKLRVTVSTAAISQQRAQARVCDSYNESYLKNPPLVVFLHCVKKNVNHKC